MDFSNFKEYITLVVALIGAVLGVLNYWRSLSAGRVKLKVTPAHVIHSGQQLFSIEVLNLSAFDLNIQEVGFFLSDGYRSPVLNPVPLQGAPLPKRLQSRESVSVYFDPLPFLENRERWKSVYARTASGELVKGNSPALEQLKTL